MDEKTGSSAQAGSGEGIPKSEPVPGENLPATFVNQFYVSVTAAHTRLTLGEYIYVGSHQVYPRAAFVIPTVDALKLANLILELHEKHIAPSQSTPNG